MPAGGGGGEQFWIATGPQSPIPWITTTKPAQANYLLGPFTTVKAAVAAARKAGYPKVALPKAGSTRQPRPGPGPGAGPGTSKPPKAGSKRGAPPGASLYANPLRAITGLAASRVDQGVDYSGTGPVYALGPGQVVLAEQGPSTGWGPPQGAAPGGYIEYVLTGGPAAGRRVYVAEGVTPAVQVGDVVGPQTVIGNMSAPIETGWASGTGTESAARAAGQGTGVPSTAFGVSFNQLMSALGAPAGQVAGPVQGQDPITTASWWQDLPTIFGGIGGTILGGSGALGSLSETGHWLGVIVSNITDIHMWISLGWMALGLLLVIIGISWLLRIPDRFKGFTSDVRAQVASAL